MLFFFLHSFVQMLENEFHLLSFFSLFQLIDFFFIENELKVHSKNND